MGKHRLGSGGWTLLGPTDDMECQLYEALLIRRASVSDRRVALHHSVQFSVLSSGLRVLGGYGLRVGLAREQLYLPPREGRTGNHHPASILRARRTWRCDSGGTDPLDEFAAAAIPAESVDVGGRRRWSHAL